MPKPRPAPGPTPEEILSTKATHRVALDRVNAEKAAARSAFRKIVAQLEQDRDALSAELEILTAIDGSKPKALKVTAGKKGPKPEAAYVAMASDWHVGERVRPNEVRNRNEYNPEIARERAAQFFRSNLTMLEAARSAWDVRRLVLWLGGDFMTGWIHEELVSENFLSPIEEALLAFDLIAAGILFLLARSDVEFIDVPTSVGNHGRMTKKMPKQGAGRVSFEQLLYRMLAKHFADEPRVRFYISEGYHNVVDIYGLRVGFHHGDGLKFGGGIGGVCVPFYKRIGRLAQGGGASERIEYWVQGHLHQLQFPRSGAFNGSLIGWNSYAETSGFEFEPPQQGSFVVDAKYRCVSNMNPIIVDKRRS